MRVKSNTLAHRNNGLVQRDPANGHAGGKGAEQSAGHGSSQQDEGSDIVATPDKAAKGLRKPGTNDSVIMGVAAMRHASRGMQYRRLGPWHSFHDQEPE